MVPTVGWMAEEYMGKRDCLLDGCFVCVAGEVTDITACRICMEPGDSFQVEF
jgi:hypothetical protein